MNALRCLLCGHVMHMHVEVLHGKGVGQCSEITAGSLVTAWPHTTHDEVISLRGDAVTLLKPDGTYFTHALDYLSSVHAPRT